MPPSARVQAAFKAMADIGIPQQKTKTVLKRLMKACEKNWTLIEEENYRLLADAIFEEDDTTQGNASAVEAQQQEEPERPSKRSRSGQDASNGGQSTTTAGADMLIQPKPEPIDGARDRMAPSGSEIRKNKGKQPISPESLALPRSSEPAKSNGRTSHALRLKEPDKESGGGLASKRKEPVSSALIIPKDEPYTEDTPPLQAPVSKNRPEPLPLLESGPPNANGSSISRAHVQPSASECVNGIKKKRKMPSSSVEGPGNAEGEDIPRKSLVSLEIATSSMGEVKIFLSYDSILDRPNFRLPSLDEIIKQMEDKHLGSLKAVVPSFSLRKLMGDFCDCFLEIATKTSCVSPERSLDLEPAPDSAKKSAAQGSMHDDGCEVIPSVLPLPLIEEAIANCSDNAAEAAVSVSIDYQSQDWGTNSLLVNNETVDDGHGERDVDCVQDANAQSLVIVEQQPFDLDELRCIYDAADLTRGEEKVKVPLLIESNSGSLPSFHYMSHNVVYCDAHVKILLARIGDKDCCPVCNGDCLSSSLQCVCSCKNGEGFAYTSDGLVKEEFLEECMSVVQNPQKHHLFECSVCPLEKCKGEDMSEPCKGHLKRKFIKECWSKCGCAKICVNRVVQRGMSCKLEIFWTPQGKGWGLRTLNELPKGAFVCEYVGEVLTISELHQRNAKKKSNEKHSYAAILDAGWGSGGLQDNQNLCLDSTLYGNVARFINHRCLDANLVEIPVQIETTDRHYYHVALFTTRKVDPLEELTWDYRIDFDDEENHMKTFKCLCGSSFCRDMKRSNRSRSTSNLH